MEFVIWVETRLAGRMLELRQVASAERSASGIEPEELGLTLQDGKTVLKQVQAKIVQTQVSILDTAFKALQRLRSSAASEGSSPPTVANGLRT